ncbi:insulinase family protein [candidate division KSB1 bacterium]|nr:insulinase family protein [candidate division KSB1 bacterium]
MKTKNLISCMIILLITEFGLLDLNRCLIAGTEDMQTTFKLPAYEKVVLKNGLTLYLMERHATPLIYVTAVFPGGAMYDGDKLGLANLTAEGLLFGTEKYPKEKLEAALDFLGASYQSYAVNEFAGLALSFLSKDQDTVFPILHSLMVEPTFVAAEFDKRKTRLLSELEQAKESPAEVIRNYFNNFLFENHVYGKPVDGTQGSVAQIEVTDLKAFYQAYYHPTGSALAVVGDFQTRVLQKRFEKLFEDWRGSAAPKNPALDPPRHHTQNRLLLVNKEDATETQFMIGSFGIQRNNPDYVAIQVINTILGGRFTSWLNDELRVNRGLTYGVRSYFDPFKNSGAFIISSYTQTATTIEAIDVALEVLQRLHQQGIDAETLTSAKNYIIGQFPPRYQSVSSLAGFLSGMHIYGYDESFINTFQQKVAEMTPAQARLIIEKYFPKSNLQFVLIGKAATLRESIKKYGALQEKEIKRDGY